MVVVRREWPGMVWLFDDISYSLEAELPVDPFDGKVRICDALGNTQCDLLHP